MTYNVSKIQVAVDQLDWAIRLFLDHRAYVPAITLSGASEEILGRLVGDEAIFLMLRDQLALEHSLLPKEVGDEHLNKTKNWLKHWTGLQDTETISLDLETEAIGMIIRGIANLISHDRSLTSESPRFLSWVRENRPDLYVLEQYAE